MCFPRVLVIVIVIPRDEGGEGLLKYINVGDKSTMVARLPQQVFLLFVLVTGPTMGISTYGTESPQSTRPSHPASIGEHETSGVRATEISDKTKISFATNFGSKISNDDPTNFRLTNFQPIDKPAPQNRDIDERRISSNLHVNELKNSKSNYAPAEFAEHLPNSLTKRDKRQSISMTAVTSRQKENEETWKTSSPTIYNTLGKSPSLRIRRTAVSVLLSSSDSRPSFPLSSPSPSLSSSPSLTSSVSFVLSPSDVPTSSTKSGPPSVGVRLRITDGHPETTLPSTLPISSVSPGGTPSNRMLELDEKFLDADARPENEEIIRNGIGISSLEPNSVRNPNIFHHSWTSKKLRTIGSSPESLTRIQEENVDATTWYFNNDVYEITHFGGFAGNGRSLPATTVPSAGGFGFSKRYMRDAKEDNFCEKFSVGDPGKREFYSPNYPENYPPLKDCVLVLEAEKGMLLKLDFRERFELESRTPDGECRFDYLEVRDGQYGFSPRIGTYCDKTFPPEIISQSRYLWLHFHSDDTIEYQGFKAVWTTVPRPNSGTIPAEQDPCIYYEDIPADFELKSDMIKDAKKTAENNRVALDCLWVMKTGPSMKMQLTFDAFKLEKPNDCSANFLDIFDGHTDEPSRVKKFCGSIAEALSTRSDTMYIRLYLEQKAINSSFSALITAVRDKDGNQACRDDEYDCDDATCIAAVLKCNNRRNCRFQRDEDETLCGTSTDNQDRSRIVIILVIFSLIMFGLCSAFLFNCVRKLKRDHRIIREHIRQSREDRLDEIGRRATPCPLSVSRTDLRDGGSESPAGEEVDSSKELIPTAVMSVREYTKELALEMKYGTREINDIHQSNNVSNATQERLQVSSEEPDMCDSSCQTRESLFSPTIPDGIPSSPGFSSFGYRTVPESENGMINRGSPSDHHQNYRHHHHHHHHHPPSLRQTSQPSQDSRRTNSQISGQSVSNRYTHDDNGQMCPKHNPIPPPHGWSLHETSYPHIIPEISGCPVATDNSTYRRYHSPKPDQETTICPSIYQQHQYPQHSHLGRQNTVGSGERYGSFIYGSGRASSNTASSNTPTPTTTTTTSNKTGSVSPHSATPKHGQPDSRYRAEAVIEVDQKRPFSIESTKSAPDVIATH